MQRMLIVVTLTHTSGIKVCFYTLWIREECIEKYIVVGAYSGVDDCCLCCAGERKSIPCDEVV